MTFRPDIKVTGGKVNVIELGGAPEYLATDGKSKVYVNLADKNEVAVVDLKQNKVVTRWPVAPGGKNEGMAIDLKDHALFIGCRDPQKMIVMDSLSGKILAAIPIGSMVDATRFSAGQGFASSGGTGELFAVSLKNGKWQLDQTIKTAIGARTMDIDERTHTIYLPTADVEKPAPPGGDPVWRPNSFNIVVVNQH